MPSQARFTNHGVTLGARDALAWSDVYNPGNAYDSSTTTFATLSAYTSAGSLVSAGSAKARYFDLRIIGTGELPPNVELDLVVKVMFRTGSTVVGTLRTGGYAFYRSFNGGISYTAVYTYTGTGSPSSGSEQYMSFSFRGNPRQLSFILEAYTSTNPSNNTQRGITLHDIIVEIPDPPAPTIGSGKKSAAASS